MCMKEQIQETIKESGWMNNKNTHEYMQAAVNLMFKKMYEKKGLMFFGKRVIPAIIK